MVVEMSLVMPLFGFSTCEEGDELFDLQLYQYESVELFFLSKGKMLALAGSEKGLRGITFSMM
jgi:hypothetical protein